ILIPRSAFPSTFLNGIPCCPICREPRRETLPWPRTKRRRFLRMNRRIQQPMRTKLIHLALGGLLAIGVTGAALAQDNPPPPADQNQAGPPPGGRRGMRMDPDRQLERLTRELSLTTDQQGQIKPLLVDRQQKMQALFQNE